MIITSDHVGCAIVLVIVGLSVVGAAFIGAVSVHMGWFRI